MLTSPCNVLPYYFRQTFRPMIWIFNEGEGDGIEPRLSSWIFSTLIGCRFNKCPTWIWTNNLSVKQTHSTIITKYIFVSRTKNKLGRNLSAHVWDILYFILSMLTQTTYIMQNFTIIFNGTILHTVVKARSKWSYQNFVWENEKKCIFSSVK